MKDSGKSIYLLTLFMKPIIAQLTLNINEDKKAAGQPDRQTGEVDKGMELILTGVTEGDGKIIPKHVVWLQFDSQTITF